MPPRMLLLAGLVAGCGGAVAPRPSPGPQAQPSAGPADGCVLTAGEPGSGVPLVAAGEADTALLSPVRARTPIGLSCTGRPIPLAARTWSADSSRKDWTLLVPEPARVATAWRAPAAAGALRLAGAVSMVPLDERRLVVSFREPQDTVPLVFADLALAIPPAGSASAAVRVLHSTGDLRDALDRGADLVLTAEPAVLEYAETRPQYTLHPLPWNRTYVLLLPGSPYALELSVPDTAAFGAGLAAGSVRAAARGAEPPFWWEDRARCDAAPGGAAAQSRAVLYPERDAVARALAERLVALSGTPGLVARAAPGWELPAAIARSAAAGFVVRLPRIPTLPCREIGGWPAGARALPLIDTRLTAVLRQGAPAMVVDYDGGLQPAEPR